MHKDLALNFSCEGETLFGILSVPDHPLSRAVVLIVGGPQYRVGSHRQFVQFARTLSAAGFPVLRFDYRGMGDSGGAKRPFENIDADIRAAIDALQAACPQAQEIVLWGLCDAASAACMYAALDKRVKGLVLLNPWVRNTSSYARTQVKHYYGARLFDRTFWTKLLRGEVALVRALIESSRTFLRAVMSRSRPSSRATFQARMLEGLRDFSGPLLLLMSGRDLTAREFDGLIAENDAWRNVLHGSRCLRSDLNEADHTFSSDAWKKEIENRCIAWLQSLNVDAQSTSRG
ncbi:MAG TPA: hydrolase 1, exosortase A system-associated [Burkholderiales bacterium]|nr:hydrolase 1, exosortase A system-associated [Burkholderiales bacterium]